MEYIAARMIGVQPILGDSLILELKEPKRMIFGAEFGNLDGLGKMFWPDPRSGEGTYTVEKLVSEGNMDLGEGAAVVFPQRLLTSDRIHELERLGARVILSVGDVTPHLAESESTKTIVLEVTPEALTDVTGFQVDSTSKETLLIEEYTLPQPLQINAQIKNISAPSNLLGLIAGQDPSVSSQLIVILADPGRIIAEENSSKWMPVALLMELARRYTHGSAQGAFPRRSIMVVAGTGAGLHAAFEYPVWPHRNIHAIVTLGQSMSSHLQLDTENIPVFGAPLPVFDGEDEIEVWITQALQDLDAKIQQLDNQLASVTG